MELIPASGRAPEPGTVPETRGIAPDSVLLAVERADGSTDLYTESERLWTGATVADLARDHSMVPGYFQALGAKVATGRYFFSLYQDPNSDTAFTIIFAEPAANSVTFEREG